MKTKKYYFLSVVLIIALLFIPNAVNATEPEYNYKYGDYTLAYKITSETEKTVEVIVCRDGYNVPGGIALEIPSEIDIAGTKYKVTSIAENALYVPLKSVEIPETIKSIGQFAFYQSGLTEVTIPDSVTVIGQSAFPENITIKDSYPATAARKVCSRTCI